LGTLAGNLRPERGNPVIRFTPTSVGVFASCVRVFSSGWI